MTASAPSTKPRGKYARHTKAEKAAAIVAAEVLGQTAAAEQTGIPLSTLHQWLADPQYADLRTKTRADLTAEIGALVHLVLAQIVQRLPDFEPRDLSVLFGIAVDKSQLISGQPTGRIETVTDGLNDHEKEALRKVLDEAIHAKEAANAGG